MKKGDKAAIVCCSNGQAATSETTIKKLQNTLEQIGIIPVFSTFIYEKESVFSGTAKERADSLMHFYQDDTIKAIFDISGGDLANEILPYLDFSIISKSDKLFWGYSDLTTIINAIYTKTQKPSVLYQIRNLIYENSETQIAHFTNTIMESGTQNELFSFAYDFVQKDTMEGIVVGGNIRCLLKLAGTEYFPDMNDKILFLEAYHGAVPQIVTYLSQLKQMGVFDKISGILLGTFTAMESLKHSPTVVDFVKQYAGTNIPIAKTSDIGHGTDSKGIVIGALLHLQ